MSDSERHWLSRAAPRPAVAILFGSLAFELLYIVLPPVLASQGFGPATEPAWLLLLFLKFIPAASGTAIFFGLGVPSRKSRATAKSEQEKRIQTLTMELERLRLKVKDLELGKGGDPTKAQDRPLVEEPTAEQKRDWYSKGQKVWDRV